MSSNDHFDASDEFAVKLTELVDHPLFEDSDRLVTSHVVCSISFEHWTAVRCLLRAGLLLPSAVIHRSQFEALLRAMWLLYAATDAQVTKLATTLNADAEQQAKNLPLAADMMKAIEKAGPANAFIALNRFKENSWGALNSYVHAGIHPIQRHADGYPPSLLKSVLANANGLAVVTAMQVSVLAGIPTLQRNVLDLAAQYPDCMPPPI
ncbi:MAG: hypothetical protein EAZ43_16445 [Betaproteobacteria bacterium]|nr:MAG: hypothetical protein EAZ43_16445 [Betaproteobacteria bacterium]